ncbi:hypothetical protein GQ600_24132 [Phytophthora cactorum]|nr:hypothetical protein GQ600_24132 [Phytophthora cactorum]
MQLTSLSQASPQAL